MSPELASEDVSGESRLREIRGRALAQPAELSAPSLIDVRLVSLGPTDHRLIWTQPALLGDAASVGVMVGELLALYTGNSDQRAGGPMQYADLAEWLNEILDDHDAAEGLGFWRQRLREPLPAAFPLASSGGQASYEPRCVPVLLSNDTAASLRASSDRLGVSTETLLLCLWQVLVSRFTDTRQVRIDTLFDGRSYDGLDRAVGLLARHLPISLEIQDDSCLADLAPRLAARCAEAGEWQEYFCGERLERGGGPSSYGFAYHPGADLDCGDLQVSSQSYRAWLQPHLLELSCTDSSGRLDIEVIFDGARLDEAGAEIMAASFAALCAGAPRHLETPVDRLPLTDEDTTPRLGSAPPASMDPPAAKHVTAMIEETVSSAPDRPAVTCGDESTSYGELWRRAGMVARRLWDEGAGPETLVAVSCERSIDMVVGILGVLRCGGAYLPLDPDLPSERLDFMVRDAAASLLVYHAATAGRVAALPVTAIDLATVEPGEPEKLTGPSEAGLAYVIYTSGSTGAPKGVAVTHSNLAHSTNARQSFYGEAPDRFLLLSSFAFDSSIVGLFWTLSTGGHLFLPEEGAERDAGLLADLVERHAITHTLCLPSLYSMLLEQASPRQLASLSLVAVAGEACPATLVQRHLDLPAPPRLVNEYGPTEGTVWALAAELTERSTERSVPIGESISCSHAYLLDPNGLPVPTGVAGEIYLGGANITRGYLARPELTAERYLPDPLGGSSGARRYRTGDRGRRRLDGQIEFLGRLDRQVKVRGYRIEPGEIESRLEDLDGIRRAVVVARPLAADELSLVAYVVSSHTSLPNVSELRAALRRQLPDYMVPAIFVELDELPLTPTGKVDRAALPEPATQRPDLAADYEAAASPLEHHLVERWQDVLQTDRVGVLDNFFELGGNSIQAAIFMNRLRSEIDDFVQVGRLFEHPTIRRLAAYLEGEHAPAVARLGSPSAADGAPSSTARDTDPAALVAEMSDEEVDSMLEDVLSAEERNS